MIDANGADTGNFASARYPQSKRYAAYFEFYGEPTT